MRHNLTYRITPLKFRAGPGHDSRLRPGICCPLLPPIHELIGLGFGLPSPRVHDLMASSRNNSSVDILLPYQRCSTAIMCHFAVMQGPLNYHAAIQGSSYCHVQGALHNHIRYVHNTM